MIEYETELKVKTDCIDLFKVVVVTLKIGFLANISNFAVVVLRFQQKLRNPPQATWPQM
jgi:hypothetical protein